MTIAALLLALAVADPKPAPLLPTGIGTEPAQIAYRIQGLLGAQDWAGASALLGQMPKRQIRMQWDVSALPAPLRAEYATARDRALAFWQDSLDLRIEWVTSKPDLKFTFSDVLQNDPETGLPKGIALFYGAGANDPRVEAAMGIRRGSPLANAEPNDIFSNVLFAVGSYFGLAPNPLPGFAMSRTDVAGTRRTQPATSELVAARNMIELGDVYRQAIADKTPLTGGVPSVRVDPRSVEIGKVNQGDRVPYGIQLSNQGRGVLVYRFQADCGCVTIQRTGRVNPGDTVVVPGQLDATEFTGEIDKRLILFTNDPEMPVRTIPVTADIAPAFRWVGPEGGTAILPADGGTVDYLFLPGRPMEVREAAFEGPGAQASLAPYKGPEGDGYRVRLVYGKPVVPGREAGAIVLKTNDRAFGTIRHPAFAQRGIVAMPDTFFWGELGAIPRRASFLVSRPGKPFALKGLRTDSPNLKVTAVNVRDGWEYRVEVSYDGKGQPGAFAATVIVETDDPAQPQLKIPVTATVR